jgi:hypothetical protein
VKLKDFPLVMRAFKEIELDNGGSRARCLLREPDVPDYWQTPMLVAEETFRQCGDKVVSGVWELAERETSGEYYPHTPLWTVVALPVDDDDKKVYEHLGLAPAQGWLTTHLLGQFFDGELSGVFTAPRRPL